MYRYKVFKVINKQARKEFTNMTNESKLKKMIREELDKATNELLHGTAEETAKRWLQSLQRIDEYCKERNRY